MYICAYAIQGQFVSSFAVMQSISILKSGKQNKILTFGSGTPTTQSTGLMFARKVKWTRENHSASLNSTFLIWKMNLINLVHLLLLVNYYQSISDKYSGIIS